MKSKLRIILIVIFSGILVFALSQILLAFLDDQQAQALHDEIIENFVTIIPTDSQPLLVDDDLENPTLAVGDDDQDTPPEASEPPPPVARPVVQSAADVAVDFAGLRAINNDIIGWIMIERTAISYPLVQGADNVRYLTTTFNGRQNRQGSIFMDAHNCPNFSHRHTLIYGHNMANNSKFGLLGRYAQQSFFERHRYFHILTETGLRRYEVISAYTADVDSLTYQRSFPNEGDFEAFLDFILSQSQVNSGVELSANEQIVTLSTCTPTSSIQYRFVVHGRLVSITPTATEAAPATEDPPAEAIADQPMEDLSEEEVANEEDSFEESDSID